MKVILLKSVPKVGKKNEIVDVADGYAQHALLPKKVAIPATPKAIALLQTQLAGAVAEKQVRHQLLNDTVKRLNGMDCTMTVKANEQGNLFSKIRTADIVNFLRTQHIAIDEAHLVVPEIKKIGKYTIGVQDEEYMSQFTITLTR
jgi:large subunit ribosomal protein L9